MRMMEKAEAVSRIAKNAALLIADSIGKVLGEAVEAM